VPWQNVRGHDKVVAELRQCMAQGRFPHALFFAGPQGIGKRSFAVALTQALLCEHPTGPLDACGRCAGCLQVEAGTHPDFMQAKRPEDKHELPIAVIRDLCADLSLKPARGQRKVAIVDDADAMNEEAANAFLKTLEEPPPGSVLILIGSAPETQLETVLSRCRLVRFDPLSETDLTGVLLALEAVSDAAEATRLARLGEGSVARALGLANPALAEFRRSMIDQVAEPGGFDAPGLARRIEAFAKEAGKESVDQRARASLLVGELARLFRATMWQTAGVEPPWPDPADRSAIAELARGLDPEDVLVLADRCLEADYHIQRRVYLGFVIEALTCDMGRLINARR
jgi:DNA polymerase-3 subunit delta'